MNTKIISLIDKTRVCKKYLSTVIKTVEVRDVRSALDLVSESRYKVAD